MPSTLTNEDARRLAGVLARLASNHEGEVLAAAAAAIRLIRTRGVEWTDVLTGAPQGAGRAPPPPPGTDWRADLVLALHHLGRLSRWESGFVTNLRGRTSLSPRQREVLRDIAASLHAGAAAAGGDCP